MRNKEEVGQGQEAGEKGKVNVTLPSQGTARRRQNKCSGKKSYVSWLQFQSSLLQWLRTPLTWCFCELEAAEVCDLHDSRYTAGKRGPFCHTALSLVSNKNSPSYKGTFSFGSRNVPHSPSLALK